MWIVTALLDPGGHTMTVQTQPLSGTFVADPAHSSFQFQVRHMGVSLFRASFADVEARLTAAPDGLRVEGVARAESVSITAPAEFREHVVYGEDFFDAHRNPQITVASDDVRLAEDGTVTARGTLTVRGVTRPVAATGTYTPLVEDPYGTRRMAIELSTTVDRRDWGLDWQMPLPKGGDALGYPVQIDAHLELLQQAGR